MLARSWRLLAACGLVAGSLMLNTAAQAVTFAFDNYLNAANDFSITSDGQSATFSSASGPGTFTVNPSADIFSFPVALGGFGNFNGDPLTITFSDMVSDTIVIPFGVFEPYATAPVTLVATANTGQTAHFTTAFNNLISGSPEGVVTFVPTGPISSLTLATLLTSTGPAGPASSVAFAIASVDVPEPISVALLGGGLAMLAVMRRRWS